MSARNKKAGAPPSETMLYIQDEGTILAKAVPTIVPGHKWTETIQVFGQAKMLPHQSLQKEQCSTT
jgi:hypothetical protein